MLAMQDTFSVFLVDLFLASFKAKSVIDCWQALGDVRWDWQAEETARRFYPQVLLLHVRFLTAGIRSDVEYCG